MLILWCAVAQSRPIAVEGDVALRAELERRLVERGFSIASGARARASIFARGGSLEAHATDEGGRTAQRTLPDLDTAAIWIESWVRTELYAPLLEVEPPPPPPEARAPIRPLETGSITPSLRT